MLDPEFGELGSIILENLPLGVLVFRLDDPADDASLRLLGVNPAAARMLRSDLKSAVGKRIREGFPQAPDEQLRAYAECCRNGGERELGELPYGDDKVEKSVYLVRAVGLPSSSVAIFIESLTQQRKAEREAKSTTVFLDAIVENIPNMIFVKEGDELRFVRFNRAGEELLGVERAAFMGKNDYDFFPAEQAKFFQERDREAMAGGKVVDIPEEPIQTANGPKVLHTRKVPMPGPDGKPRYLLGISEDITDQKAAEARMRELLNELEASNAELDGFTYSVSHDLRAPLRAVDGFARVLIEDHGDKLGDEGLRVARVIVKNAVKGGQLIDDLLQFARMGRKQIDARPVDMTALAREAAGELRTEGRAIDLAIAELPVARGDPALLKQVWLNLLGNAVKYTQKMESARIDVTGSTGDGLAIYVVKDNGVGFEQQYVSKLFGVFQRLHPVSEYEGTGVGLALANRIVKRHGGWIRGDSAVGQGATFTFALPVTGET